MSFSTLKLIPPTLEAKDRTSAEDLLTFITFEQKMEPFLRVYDLWNVTCGDEVGPLQPQFEEPTNDEIEKVENNQSRTAVRFSNLMKRRAAWLEYYKEVREFDQKRLKAVANLKNALNQALIIRFCYNSRSDDPRELWTNLKNYFMQNSSIIISNLQSEFKNITLNNR